MSSTTTKMKTPISLFFSLVSLLPFISFPASSQNLENFLQCLSLQFPNSSSITNVTYTQQNSSYESVLEAAIRNRRFNTPSTPKPIVIVTPLLESHIQATIHCSKEHGMNFRIRSGGHDYEGLSYVSSETPFVILDLVNFRSVEIDVGNGTAWVQSGATIGELYNTISKASSTLGYTAGVWSTVGVGGHFSGGGYGWLTRKYGLASDNVIDARLIDVNGRILDRKSMGEDLFWAIRGGGGASLGVILAWKINLVSVPETVTVFRVPRTLEQNATSLVHRWQYVADKMDENLTVRIFLRRVNSSQGGNGTTVEAAFTSLYLGGIDTLLPLMQQSFPELGLVRENCTEMSWIQSVLNFGGFSINQSVDVLLNRSSVVDNLYFKGKSDFVTEPISLSGIEMILTRFNEQPQLESSEVSFNPYGGRMSEISVSETPFPYRNGTTYNLHYSVSWQEEGTSALNRHMNWIRDFYGFMAPYVTQNPRSAYLNYRDLDIGVNNGGNSTSYEQASVWGLKYFGVNFERLARVKTAVDPGNFFRDEQSIPVR